jgi:hypothetical protein
MSKVAEQLEDGRYIVDPSKIDWEDVLTFEKTLDGGPFPEEPREKFLVRCVKTLMGIPDPKDVYVQRHEEAIAVMLDNAAHKQDGGIDAT